MMNVLPDIPRFYTALAEWAACMILIFTVKRRIKGWRLFGASAGMMAFQSAFLILTKNVSYWLWLPCMIAAVLFMVGFVWVCIDGGWCDAVYCGLQAFVIAEFAASLEWQIYFYFWYDRASEWVSHLVLLVCYGVVYFAVWRLFYDEAMADKNLQIVPRELSFAFIITISAFTMSNLGFLDISTPFTIPNGVFVVRTMMDLAGVAMIYAYRAQRNEIRVRRELDVMQNVLENQYLQYQQSKESIDLINFKYHDLKHQIAILRSEESSEKRNAFLNRMEEEICQYEVQNKTGHKVVDTILTSKNITCEKYGISLNCVANGTLLNFMDVVDICSILGNALDNAIEYEKKISDREKRLIHAAIFSQRNFVILRFENYFEGKLKMNEGIPVTTKKWEREYHGYGIKSIKHTVKKYDGAVSIHVKDNWFELKILIPMPEKISL